jgi:hypothetical protein
VFPIEIPPGIQRNSTEYATGGRWYDANLVRFYSGQARPIGGWTKVTASALTGKCRELLSWRTNADAKWLAMGTSQKLYATKLNGTVYDITPAGFTVGSDDVVEGSGYGVGSYGDGLYGTARSTPVVMPLSVWHLDTWGEYLVGCMRGDGKLYEWTLNGASPAAVISNAPTGCIGVMVTEQRHMLALGAGSNPRKVQWCHKENNTSWTAGPLTEAGSFDLQTNGVIQRGLRVRGQNLILTDVDAHTVNWVGYPLVYGRTRVGTDCGIIGPAAAASVESFGVWMGQQGFWIYEGSGVRALPCDVQDFVFSRINRASAAKTRAGHNGTFGEVWWFYPSGQSNEPDSYVIWNYRENTWTISGAASSTIMLTRTSWIDSGAFPYPMAAGTDNHIYRQEDGLLADGTTRVGSVYLRSGAFDINDGEDILHIRKVLPDEKASGAVNVTFYVRQTPNGTEYTKGPYTVRADGYTDCRFSGRQAAMKVTAVDDSDWRIGKFRLEGTAGGKR